MSPMEVCNEIGEPCRILSFMNCLRCGEYIPVEYRTCPKCHSPVRQQTPPPPPKPPIVEAELVDAIPPNSKASEPQQRPPKPPRHQDLNDTKKCPYCAEEIKIDAIICRFCRMNLKTGRPLAVDSGRNIDVVDIVKWGCGLVLGLPLAMFIILILLIRGC